MQASNEMEQEVMAAERAVNEARDKLVAELEAASANGRQAIERVVEHARPLVLAAATIAGIAVIAGTVALVRRSFSRARPRYWVPPRQRSVFGQAARQALASAAGTLAAALARRALVSLELAPATDGLPAEPPTNARPRSAKRARVNDLKPSGH